MPDLTGHFDRLDTCGYLGVDVVTECPGRQKDPKAGQSDETERIIILEGSVHLPVHG